MFEVEWINANDSSLPMPLPLRQKKSMEFETENLLCYCLKMQELHENAAGIAIELDNINEGWSRRKSDRNECDKKKII